MSTFFSYRIMMLSVLKTTKHPVKFWFLQNYLSPYFKVSTLIYSTLCLYAALKSMRLLRD